MVVLDGFEEVFIIVWWVARIIQSILIEDMEPKEYLMELAVSEGWVNGSFQK